MCKFKEYKFLIITNNTTMEDAAKGSVVIRALQPVEENNPILIDDDEIIGTYRKKKLRSKKDTESNKNIPNKKIKQEN